MKPFRASVIVNILLLGLVLWLVRPAHVTEKISSAPTVALSANQTASSPQPERTPMVPAFRWSQLESVDYRTYIANLRGFGCPEQTIRDIIAADVDAAFYAAQRDQLKQRQTAQSLESALQKLNQQEASFIASLFGGQSAAPEVAFRSPRVTPILRVKSQTERDLDRSVSMPLVLQPVDPVALKLSEAQIQTIDEIRQTFLQEIGGTNQDPNDPVYRQRWQTAQREADDMLSGMFGRNFTLNYQMRAESEAAQIK